MPLESIGAKYLIVTAGVRKEMNQASYLSA